MNMALSVAENFIGKSPSLRRVSVNHDEAPKAGFFGKKKAQEPSLVFTFTADDFVNDNKDFDGNETKSSGFDSVVSEGSFPNFNLKANSQDMDNMKLGSIASYKTTHTQVSTVQEELEIIRKQRFFDFLTMVLSICYGIFVIITSLGIYCSDLLLIHSYEYNNSEIWNLLLSSVGILLLLWLTYDIQKYIQAINKLGNSSSFFDNLRLVEGPDGELNIELPMIKGKKKNVPEYYAFATGRHAGSFFLKIGAAVFCFGHLIHMGLNFVKHIYSMTDDDAMIEKYCGQKEGLAYDIIYPVFSLLQLYFIFKFGNVIVMKNKWLARLTFMHCMSSSFSFWMNTLVNETLDAIVKKYFVKELSSCYNDQASTTSAFPNNISASMANEADEIHSIPVSGYKIYELAPCLRNITGSITNNVLCAIETRAMCNDGENADDLFAIAPWFYPFSIEFCILIAAVWFILWSSIGKIQDHRNNMDFLPSVTPQGSMENLHRTAGLKQAMILFADCSSSNMGIFFGVVLMVFVLVTSIFVTIKEGDCNPSLAITIGNIMKITVLIKKFPTSFYEITLQNYVKMCQKNTDSKDCLPLPFF